MPTHATKQKAKAKGSATARAKAGKLLGPRKGFYKRMSGITEKARKGNIGSKKHIESIVKYVAADARFKDELGKRVRVPPVHQPGSVGGVGMDEALKTSETARLLQQSAGLLKGIPATFPMKAGGKQLHVTPFELQDKMRQPTNTMIFNDGTAHEGGLLSAVGGTYLTKMSQPFHNKRNEYLLGSKNPRNQVGRTLLHNVHGTANWAERSKIKTGVDPGSGLDLSIAAHRKQWMARTEEARNRRKQDARGFRPATKSPPGSPLYKPSKGPPIPPLSPLRNPLTGKPLSPAAPPPFSLDADKLPHFRGSERMN